MPSGTPVHKWHTEDGVHWSIPLTSGQIAFRDYMSRERYHGREYYLLFFTCYLDTSSLPAEQPTHMLRTAWKALRRSNPVIATQNHGTDMIYEAVTAAGLDAWADDTFVILDSNLAPEDHLSLLPEDDRPQLLYFPVSGAVSLRFSHWRASLLGLASLMDRLLDFVVDPSPRLPTGDEVKNLTVPYEYQFECFANDNPAARQRVQDMVSSAFAAAPGTGLLLGASQRAPETSKTTTMILTEESTNELLKATKKKGLKLAPLFHAALTQTVWDLEPAEFKGRTQIASVYRDHRRFRLVPAALAGPDYADQNLVRESLLVVGRELSFPDLIDYFMRVYHTDFNEEAYFETYDAYAANFNHILANLPHPRALMGSLPRLSSLGVLDQYIKRSHEAEGRSLTVKDISLQAENPTTENTFWPHTWNDRLRVTSTWNPAYYDKEAIQRLFASLFKYVGLGVGVQVAFTQHQSGA